MLDAGSEGEGGALGLDVDGVGPRETLVTGGGLRGALIDEAGGLTLALRNTALGCSIIQGLKLLKKWFNSTDDGLPTQFPLRLCALGVELRAPAAARPRLLQTRGAARVLVPLLRIPGTRPTQAWRRVLMS